MTTVRTGLVRLASRTARLLSWVLLRLLPARRHALVHGWPDNEANAVEVVRGLLRRYPGRICWLLDDPAFTGPFTAELDDPRLVRLHKDSPAGLVAALTAEVTFYTHGLTTAVAPPPSRLVVNLWHGDGPKSTRQPRLVKSTVVVSGARLWADYKAELFRLPRSSVLVSGNPRIDQFDEPVPGPALRRLGLDPARRRVLWLPTYREARGARGRAWSDGAPLSDSPDVLAMATALSSCADALQVDLVIKPHPLDGDSYAGLGCTVVTGTQLDEQGVSLYQLIGSCDALISDVSSAWVDYLVLDRPIGFYLPDLEELERRRGLNVADLAALLPGPRLAHPRDAAAFMQQVVRAPGEVRPSGFPGAARIGAVTTTGATDRLLDELADFQRGRGRRPLFDKAR